MHLLTIIGLGFAASAITATVVVAVVIYRFDRWADAMILSFGLLELWPLELSDVPGEFGGDASTDAARQSATANPLRVRWDRPQNGDENGSPCWVQVRFGFLRKFERLVDVNGRTEKQDPRRET